MNIIHHAGILLSHPGVGYLYPPPPHLPVALAPMLSHISNYFLMRTTTTTQLNKLPLSAIIFRTTDNTKCFLITTKNTTQYVSIRTASNETLTFYFRFLTTNMCYF